MMVAMTGKALLNGYAGTRCTDLSMQLVAIPDLDLNRGVAVKTQSGLRRRERLMAATAFVLEVCVRVIALQAPPCAIEGGKRSWVEGESALVPERPAQSGDKYQGQQYAR